MFVFFDVNNARNGFIELWKVENETKISRLYTRRSKWRSKRRSKWDSVEATSKYTDEVKTVVVKIVIYFVWIYFDSV